MTTRAQLLKLVVAGFEQYNIEKLPATRIKAIIYLYEQITLQKIRDGEYVNNSLGQFYLIKTEARNGINPYTGANIRIPAKNRLRFKPSINIARFVK